MKLDQEALDIEITGDFSGTLGDLFKELALKVWIEEEGFSGKRPFGNSDWKCDVYKALVLDGAIPGTVDEYGCEEGELDTAEIDMLVAELVVDYL